MTGILGIICGGFPPTLHTDSVVGAGKTETVPAGATKLTIKLQAIGGTGGISNPNGGGGGGAGGYSESDAIAVTGGKTLTYTLGGSAAASSVSSGTLAITTMTANFGATGSASAGGTGGTASGGTTTNTTGATGTNGGGGTNGAGGVGTIGGGFGSGGIGGFTVGGTPGAAEVIFSYT